MKRKPEKKYWQVDHNDYYDILLKIIINILLFINLKNKIFFI